MRFAPAFRRRFVVAVESQTVERAARHAPADPDTQAGARWGRPANFDLASRARASDAPGGFSATWIDSARVFKGTELHREYNHAPPASAASSSSLRASGASPSTAAQGKSGATSAA